MEAGAPCCYRHYQLGLVSLGYEQLRASRVPREMSPGERMGWNARLDLAFGAGLHQG
jgi:hypothetical protein